MTLTTTPHPVDQPAADPLTQTPPPARDLAPGTVGPAWTEKTVASLRDAESLLDWLEAQGHQDREFVIVNDTTFVVRWR